jgi:hypothetical protein
MKKRKSSSSVLWQGALKQKGGKQMGAKQGWRVNVKAVQCDAIGTEVM